MSGSPIGTDSASVLIVEAEPELGDLYASWLEECHVETASDGSEAIEAIGERFDVVLFDRRTPGLSAQAIFDLVRDRMLECRVVLVTTVESGLDALGAKFDDHLRKPVSKEELRESIERLLLRRIYDERLQELFALASEKALLNGRKSDAEIQSSREYAELEDRLAVLRVHADESRAELLERDGYRVLYRDITRSSSTE